MQFTDLFPMNFKHLLKPVFHKGLVAFNLNENVARSFYLNLDLNDHTQQITFLPGYFSGKIEWGN